MIVKGSERSCNWHAAGKIRENLWLAFDIWITLIAWEYDCSQILRSTSIFFGLQTIIAQIVRDKNQYCGILVRMKLGVGLQGNSNMCCASLRTLYRIRESQHRIAKFTNTSAMQFSLIYKYRKVKSYHPFIFSTQSIYAYQILANRQIQIYFIFFSLSPDKLTLFE